MGLVTPDMLPAVVATAVVVLLLVLGTLRVATGYRKVRSKLRRLSQTRPGHLPPKEPPPWLS